MNSLGGTNLPSSSRSLMVSSWKVGAMSESMATPPTVCAVFEVGTAWVNQHRATAANVPFGGIKESGIGRNYSVLGLKGNMEARVISVLKT